MTVTDIMPAWPTPLRQLLLTLPDISRSLSIVALAALLTACRMEANFIFYPSATIEHTPREVGLEFEDVFFATRDDVRLNGWFIPHREARSTLVWFHGNAGNISHRVENIKLLHDKVKINIFIFDYRGYGRSEGRVSEEGTYLDGEAALDYVREQLDVKPKKIVLFGRSLGAAVAAEMANRYDSQGLILESPFVSIREMARVVFPLLPIGPLLQTRYDVREKIRKIKTPLLVLHGDRDEVVPFAQGKMVFDAAPEPKKFFTIAGAQHNDTYLVGGDSYFQQLQIFIEWAASIQR
ncbi:MAG: alpha/beta hydrolase [Deltaproteobacteria bacterium]|nr:MAG: alpha/beta hydrolase [Deltaproteobacteria bacterium]